MIVFYESLPRVGKSYTSVTKNILDALKIGQHVMTGVVGFNLEVAVELLEKAIGVVHKLVKVLTDEEVTRIHEHVVKDTLCVLDEGQDYWPSNFKPLGKATTKLVTQYGHDGINAILVGQDLNDLHNIWKRCAGRKYASQKEDAIGKPNEFEQTVYKKVEGQKGDRFEKISDGSGRYEEKYFGLCKSHMDGTTNTDTLEDSDANVLKTKVLRVQTLLFALVVFDAIGPLVYLFKGGDLAGFKPEDKHVVTKTVATSSTSPTLLAERIVAAAPAKTSGTAVKSVPEDDGSTVGLVKECRPRLEGWARVRGQADVIIARYNDSTRVRERLSTATTRDSGQKVQESQHDQHVILAKGERRIVMVMQPIDIYDKVPGKQVDDICATSGAGSRAARDEYTRGFGPRGWCANDDQVMGRSVVGLPPSIVSIPDDVALPRYIRRDSAFDDTQHWSHG